MLLQAGLAGMLFQGIEVPAAGRGKPNRINGFTSSVPPSRGAAAGLTPITSIAEAEAPEAFDMVTLIEVATLGAALAARVGMPQITPAPM